MYRHNTPKNIFIIYSNLDTGGIPTKIIDIVNAMRTSAPERHVEILLQKGHPDDLRNLIINPNATVSDAPYHFIHGNRLLFIVWMWIEILKKKPSAILAFISPYALPTLAAKIILFWQQFRVIISEDHYTNTMLSRMAFPAIQRLGIRLLYPLADGIVAPTKIIAKQLSQLSHTSLNRMSVVPNWTRLADVPIQTSIRRWDIIHIGRLVKSKHPLDTVRIMASYIHRHPKSHCAIVGDGPERNRLETYIKQHHLDKHIHLFSASTDVSGFLLNAYMFLFLPESHTEGFPIVLLEAMACGAIVVTKDFAGVGSVISDRTGIIAHTYSDLVHQVNNMRINFKRNALMRDRAKAFVMTHNSITNADNYIRLLL
jgi:glycosyltransferase involved in cell wall biosynthesis